MFLLSILLLTRFGLIHAAPANSPNQFETPFYYPDSTFEVYPLMPQKHLKKSTHSQNVQSGLEFLRDKWNVQENDPFHQIKVSHSFQDVKGVSHIYVKRWIGDHEVENHQAQIHVKNGEISAFSSTFHLNSPSPSPLSKRQEEDRLDLQSAKTIASQQLGIPVYEEFDIKKVYLETGSDNLVLAYQLQLRNASEWLQVNVDAMNGKLLQVVNFKAFATYNVIPFGETNPSQSSFRIVTDPQNPKYSPLGWHNDGNESFTTTSGNNVIVYTEITQWFFKKDFYQVDGGSELTFQSEWDGKQDPKTPGNLNVSETNLFYLLNMFHDFLYEYGFTESAGNFQNDNFDKGGLGNDAVIAMVQDPAGENNAYFMCPPDGQNGFMHMFLFSHSRPKRDGALDNSVPLHEYFHGVSNRLTGGSHDGQCLQTLMSRGMGEGWSDAIALYVQRKEADSAEDDVNAYEWPMNSVQNGVRLFPFSPPQHGLRIYPFSTNMTRNPLIYSRVTKNPEPHVMGEIWVAMLNDMWWNLRESFGFSSNLFDSKQSQGNIVAIQLLMGGLMIQPCNPSFINARDAILQADVNYYNGRHTCAVWKAFAKRGLGVNASEDFIDDFEVPTKCQ